MHVRPLIFASALLACAALGACATNKQPASAMPASEVQVYGSTQLVSTQYTLVEHIWTDGWGSNFSLPAFDTADAGIQALKEEAAGVGASGLLNVMCFDAAGYANGRLLCYGDAIKFN